jgi:hypothetical protein
MRITIDFDDEHMLPTGKIYDISPYHGLLTKLGFRSSSPDVMPETRFGWGRLATHGFGMHQGY